MTLSVDQELLMELTKDKIEANLAVIRPKREQDSILLCEAYCQNTACSVREVTIHIKDYDATFIARASMTPMVCPWCYEALKMHWVKTRSEYLDEREMV